MDRWFRAEIQDILFFGDWNMFKQDHQYVILPDIMVFVRLRKCVDKHQSTPCTTLCIILQMFSFTAP